MRISNSFASLIRCVRTLDSEARPSSRGFTLIEVMVAMLVLGLAATAAVLSFSTSLFVWKHTEAHNAASDIAASRVEELAAVPPASLNSSYNENEHSVSWPGLSFPFKRNTVVTNNSDGSRTISVRVWSDSANIKTSVNFSTRFARWQ